MLVGVWAYGAWATYRFDRRGWWVIVGAMVLYCLSNVITYSRHDLADISAAMRYSPAQLASMQAFSMGQRTIMWGH